jgi:O-antigen/teichoic acid export membrane protein
MDNQSVTKISFVSLSVFLLIGIVLYYLLPETVWAGAGLSTAFMSFVSLLHFKFRNQNQDKSIESKFTWLLLLCMIIGIMLIFSNKSFGASDFYVGIGAGIALVSGLTYCLELIMRFVDGVR